MIIHVVCPDIYTINNLYFSIFACHVGIMGLVLMAFISIALIILLCTCSGKRIQ